MKLYDLGILAIFFILSALVPLAVAVVSLLTGEPT